MSVIVERISTVTSKGQTTVPKPVRDALGLESGDRIAFRVGDAGVTLHRVDQEEDDPVIDAFLSLLARDMEQRPERLGALTQGIAERIAALTEGVAIGPDETVEGAVDLRRSFRRQWMDASGSSVSAGPIGKAGGRRRKGAGEKA